MTGFAPATLDFYAKEAPVYVASGRKGAARHLAGFLEKLSPGANILELGCGGGLDAAYMLDGGFKVDPTDGTPEIAAQAEARLQRPVRVVRFDELSALEVYDAVVASASLLHVPRMELTSVLHLIWLALKPGGWHVASYKGGGQEGRDRMGRYFNYLNADEIRKFYNDAGCWSDIEILSGMGGGYDGVDGPWHVVTVRKVGD